MRLAEKLMPRRYHALDNGWTPLSRNPCWLSIAFHCLRYYVKRNRLVLISPVGYYRQRLLPTNHKLIFRNDKSFADDLVASGYCKHRSSLCATTCWDFSRVPTICSSLFCNSQFCHCKCSTRVFRVGWTPWLNSVCIVALPLIQHCWCVYIALQC